MATTKAKKKYNPQNQVIALSIPNWLSQVPNKQLSHGAKQLYARLCKWAYSTGIAFRSCVDLGREIGCNERQAQRFIKDLKDAELIGSWQPDKGCVNYYEFYEHPWMFAPIVDELLTKSERDQLSTATDNLSYGVRQIDVGGTTNCRKGYDKSGIHNNKQGKDNNKINNNPVPSVSVDKSTPKHPQVSSQQIQEQIKIRFQEENIQSNAELIEWVEFHVHVNSDRSWKHAINGAVVMIKKGEFKQPKGMPIKNYHVENKNKQEMHKKDGETFKSLKKAIVTGEGLKGFKDSMHALGIIES